ncbi:helix-turn-helix domain-containing protein [Bradyrhizobium cenepequi]|uniref:helix-turn-helix domain-containing protein n=1 Tax=Bradyrhizobium cenepequi TaxID=2821403 RepID=UPI001CE3543E|nr:helix-turn-helix transcriptional regulator [Bradyrhizobium cenepequi]MCA6107949.1 helix-turn-helix domain-containing protein [Bradyrhizobium cenepequi]
MEVRLAGLSQSEVAEVGGVSVPTLKRAEAGGPIKVANDTIEVIVAALEKAGVGFIPENCGGAGMRMRGERRNRNNVAMQARELAATRTYMNEVYRLPFDGVPD